MCGVCGVIGDDDGLALQPMLRRLIHRGPDEEGIYRQTGVVLGARRLRVIDPVGGRQPVRNERGTVWAVMNGEIYNYRELTHELVGRGHRLATRCDTEVLVHLYEDEGFEAFRRLRGMFAIALWDQERRSAWLVRDRLGIKPLYYAIRQGQAGRGRSVIFSSEIPSLLEALPDWQLRPEGIAEYLTHLYVPGPATMIADVHQLCPGEAMSVSDGRVELLRYYRPEETLRIHDRWTAEEAREEVLHTFEETVQTHLVSDVPLGLFLSGGIDSASLLAMMAKSQSGPVKTFSVGYEHPSDQSFSELESARFLADHFKTVHSETMLRPNAVALIEKVVEGMGEPFADSSAIPTYLVSEVARQTVTVALSGIGGDELFGGYPRYLGLRTAAQYQRIPLVLREHMAQWSRRIGEHGNGRDQAARMKRFLGDGHLSLPEQYGRWTTFIPAEWDGILWGERLATMFVNERPLGAGADLFNQWPSSDPADCAMGVDLQSYLPDDLLRMADRMSMVHSLELRVPFCDHHLLAAALRIPSRVRLSGWQLKGFMRRLLRGLLPERILRAPKQGFMVPMARWLREDLREMAHDLLTDDVIKGRGYVKPTYVRWLLEQHERGRRNFSDQLYALIVLELWQRGLRADSSERTAAMANS
ncbi:MAG: asparagine synthase (glutamine-hydrolyzing) [Nitrospira sp.]|nr:asparagine synthase (glutamine-hydrolyzing) [Nitrospira sp.]